MNADRVANNVEGVTFNHPFDENKGANPQPHGFGMGDVRVGTKFMHGVSKEEQILPDLGDAGTY